MEREQNKQEWYFYIFQELNNQNLYVDKNYSPVNEQNIHRFDPDTEMPDWHEAVAAFAGIDNYGELCELTDDEREEIEQLWKEIAV